MILYLGLLIDPLISPDSSGYIYEAEALIQHGPVWYFSTWTIAPPIFPILIAGFMALGMSPVFSGHLVPVLSFALLVFPIFYLGKELGNVYVGYCTCILLCTSEIFWNLSAMVWTEMPYILFSAIGILYLVKYLKNNEFLYLIISGVFIALASLDRYLGLCLILSSVCVVFVHESIIKKQSLRNFLIFLSISSIPILLILIRNLFVGQDYYYSHESRINPSFLKMFIEAIFLKIRDIAPSFFPNIWFEYLIIIIILGILSFVVIKNNTSNQKIQNFLLITSPLWLYIFIYIFLFEAVYFSLKNFGEHERLQIVIIPFCILFLFSIFAFSYKNISANKWYKNFYLIIVITFFLVSAASQIFVFPYMYKNLNEGYSYFYTDIRAHSEGIQWIKNNVNNSPLYTTSEEAGLVTFYTGKQFSIFYSNSTKMENSSYIYVERYKPGFTNYVRTYTPEEFQAQIVNNSCHYRRIQDFPDSIIYQYHEYCN